METIVAKLISDLSIDELEKIKTTSGLVILIVKLIEKVHAKKNLSYEDSKKLISLVIDVLVITMKGKNISPEFDNLIIYLEQNKDVIELLVSESIDVWDAVSGLCKSCRCIKKESKIKKSVIETPQSSNVIQLTRVTYI